jgi:uncharacterized protein YhhL (DUF1145 family)
MPEPCLLDNDVVLKIATFQQNHAFLDLLTIEGKLPAILGVGAYVVRQKASQSKRFQDPQKVKASVYSLLDGLEMIEPTEQEVELAADFEASAMSAGGAFDAGEAQLLAILLLRNSPVMATGDKRAVEASSHLKIPKALNKMVCLEQIMIRLMHACDLTLVRAAVCAEPSTDKAISNCFACTSFGLYELELAAALEALQSYVNHLRQNSGEMLIKDEAFLALTT